MKLDPAGIRYDGRTNQTARVNRGMPAEPSKGNETNFCQAPQYAITGTFQINCLPDSSTLLFQLL